MLSRGFDHLSTLAYHFLECEDIHQKPSIIDQYNISGWEIWMQIEFADLLASAGHEWWREQTLVCDLRKNPQRLSVHVGFLLQEKGWTQDSHIALELKQNQDPTSYVRNMIVDLAKGAKIKRSKSEPRSFWMLGVTPHIDKERLDELIDYYLDEKYHLTKSHRKHMSLRDIGRTPCYCIVI